MYTQQRLAEDASQLLYFRHAPPVLVRHFDLQAYPLKRPQPPYKGAKGWHCSIYYFWWRFLRENEGFRTQRQSPPDSLEARVQRDFDTALKLNFPNWWIAQGRFLFCEPKTENIHVVTQPENEPQDRDRVLLSIPFNSDIERCLSEIRAVLGPVFSEMRADEGPSRARYPVASTVPLTALYKCYNIWRVRRDNPDLKLHEVALYGGLLPNGPIEMADVKRTLAAAASRYLREANAIIDNVGRGQFPVKGPAQSAQSVEDQSTLEAEPAHVDPDEMREWIKSIHKTEPELADKYVSKVLPMLRAAWGDEQ